MKNKYLVKFYRDLVEDSLLGKILWRGLFRRGVRLHLEFNSTPKKKKKKKIPLEKGEGLGCRFPCCFYLLLLIVRT